MPGGFHQTGSVAEALPYARLWHLPICFKIPGRMEKDGRPALWGAAASGPPLHYGAPGFLFPRRLYAVDSGACFYYAIHKQNGKGSY
jgi:hypothetical protein